MKYILFLFAIVAFSSCKQDQAAVKIEPVKVLAGDAQDIEVYDLAGLEKLLSQKDDKIHVVNFWATWCAPCIKEIPHFEKVNQEMDDVEVVLVSIDQESDFERLTKFVNKKAYNSDVAVVEFDSNQALADVVAGANWAGENIPVTLIYNKHKRYFKSGSMSHEELISEIEKFKS